MDLGLDAATAAREWLESYGIRTEPYRWGGGDHPAMGSLPEAFITFARAMERDTLERAKRAAADAVPLDDAMMRSAAKAQRQFTISRLIGLLGDDAPPAPEPQDRSEPGIGRLDLVRLLSRAVISLLDTRGQLGDRQRANDISRALTLSFGDAEWLLNEADSAAFVAAIENAPEPNAALRAAAERYKEHIMPINPIDDAEFGTAEWRRDHAETDPSVALARELIVVGIGNGKFKTFNVAGHMPDAEYGGAQCVVLDETNGAFAAILTSSGWRLHNGPVKLHTGLTLAKAGPDPMAGRGDGI